MESSIGSIGAQSVPQVQNPEETLQPGAPQAAIQIIKDSRDEEGVGKTPEITASAERDVIDWLLTPQDPEKPIQYWSDVDFDTPAGTMKLRYYFKPLAGEVIDSIERAGTRTVDGEVRMDDLEINAEMVSRAAIRFESPVTGKQLPLSDESFRGEVPSVTMALRRRFYTQSGLIAGLASQIRRASGWSPDRVGQANRVLVDLTGNS